MVWVASFLGFVSNKDPIVSGCFTCGKVNNFRAFKALSSSGTSVGIWYSTRRSIPEDRNIHLRRCENMKC